MMEKKLTKMNFFCDAACTIAVMCQTHHPKCKEQCEKCQKVDEGIGVNQKTLIKES